MYIPNHFPNELFALARTTQVSRRLHAVALPALYHSLEPTEQRLHILVLTLLIHPTLAFYVRSLHIGWDGYLGRVMNVNPPVSNILKIAADRFSIYSPVNSRGTQLILLMYILPHLDVINVTFLFSYETYVFSEFLNTLASRPITTLPIALQSVRVIHCYWWDTAGSLSPAGFIALLRLPSIRTVDNRIGASKALEDADVAEIERLSEVTSVGIGVGDHTMWSLVKILKVPRVLKEFRYGHWPEDDRSTFDRTVFMKALEMYRVTLECLVLCFNDDKAERWGEDSGLEAGIGSLRGWPELKRVTCSLTTLLGKGRKVAVERLVGVLPVGIRALEIKRDIYWTNEEVAEEVAHMMVMKGALGLSWLQVVTIEMEQDMMN
ncbi:hypothetical protein Q9L58_001527 [Maublancomyces gigas]|uniref:Uncharacterized protein n=1 Tax=Discina gigas TaxID=1032678 RepID=A0ABR3GUG5_9PEZI